MIRSRRLSPSLPQTPLHKSAAYEPELKDLEVKILLTMFSPEKEERIIKR